MFSKPVSCFLHQNLFSPWVFLGLPFLDSFVLSSNHICFLHFTLLSGKLTACTSLPSKKPFLLIPSLPPSLFLSLSYLLSLDSHVFSGPLQYSSHFSKYFMYIVSILFSPLSLPIILWGKYNYVLYFNKSEETEAQRGQLTSLMWHR